MERGALLNVQDLNGETPFHKFIGEGFLIGDDVEENHWQNFLALEMNPWSVSNDGKCPFEVLLEQAFFESAFNLLKVILKTTDIQTWPKLQGVTKIGMETHFYISYAF